MSVSFKNLGLPQSLVSTLNALGYEIPTPVQAQSIPVLLKGHDLIGQAQTGTGKTAAFALPVLSKIDLRIQQPQALIIAPTRELAIQVAEAFQSYAKQIKGLQVAAIYGGQDFQIQLRALKRGVHVVVGTPGRVMDHMRRGKLRLQDLKIVVLDEADEMLKMGFIDDVAWILEQIPHEHQTALFSATMAPPIRKIADNYLKNPQTVNITPKESTVGAIEQGYVCVANKEQKLEVLTRLLEHDPVEAAIVFARTKSITTELADKLRVRGFRVAALNGDLKQSQRKQVVDKIKSGELDIVVATDVAARGIDIERLSHVINFDIPFDTESYIHRIGRTGRAGRKGKAYLLITSREQRLLRDIERAIGKSIPVVTPPSSEAVQQRRVQDLSNKILSVMFKEKKLAPYKQMVDSIVQDTDCSLQDIAAACAYLLQGNERDGRETLKLIDLDTQKPERYRSHKRKNERKFSDKKFSGKKKRKFKK